MRTLVLCCLMLLWLVTGCSKAPTKQMFLPEASNDFLFTTIGESDDHAASSSTSSMQPTFSPMQIETTPEKTQYPVETKEIILTVTNHAEQDLLYSKWFDFRRIEGDQIFALEPDQDKMPYSGGESLVLKAGESVALTVPLDVFAQPLTAGVYRISQLACYADDFACTEITAQITLE